MNERDLETLIALDSACRNLERFGRAWARPMDCGGSDSSNHSYRLAKLERFGLARSQQRSSWKTMRGSKEYQVTDAGRLVIDGLTDAAGGDRG